MSKEKQGTELPKLEPASIAAWGGQYTVAAILDASLTQAQALEVIRRAEAYPDLQAELKEYRQLLADSNFDRNTAQLERDSMKDLLIREQEAREEVEAHFQNALNASKGFMDHRNEWARRCRAAEARVKELEATLLLMGIRNAKES